MAPSTMPLSEAYHLTEMVRNEVRGIRARGIDGPKANLIDYSKIGDYRRDPKLTDEQLGDALRTLTEAKRHEEFKDEATLAINDMCSGIDIIINAENRGDSAKIHAARMRAANYLCDCVHTPDPLHTEDNHVSILGGMGFQLRRGPVY